MEKKMKEIFKFLLKNKKYNNELQEKFCITILRPYKTKEERAFALMHHIFYTQSQPKLDKALDFFRRIYSDKNALNSFNNFCQFLKVDISEKPFQKLFYALKNQDGWGDKTAALFIKTVYQLHYSNQRDLYFWNDIPKINEEDKFFLPVDTVIKFIFKKITGNNISFCKINKLVENNSEWKNNFVWDDLWFWGFITQNGTGTNRKLEYNPGKYWALPYFDKRPHIIIEIEKRSKIFIELLKKKSF